MLDFKHSVILSSTKKEREIENECPHSLGTQKQDHNNKPAICGVVWSLVNKETIIASQEQVPER